MTFNKKIMQIWLLLPHIFPYREKDVIFFSGQEEQPTQLFLQWMGHTSMWKEGGRSRLCFYCDGSSRSHMSMWKFLWQIFVSESYPSNHLFDLDRRAKEAANCGRTSLQTERRGRVAFKVRHAALPIEGNLGYLKAFCISLIILKAITSM